MNRMILIVVLALLSLTPIQASAQIAPIPSDASGVYYGVGRVCRLELYRAAQYWIDIDLTCMKWTGALSNSKTRLYAPGAGSCVPNNLAVPFDGQLQNEFIAFRVYVPGVITVVVGPSQQQVSNGIGSNESWSLIAPVDSRNPFNCGAPSRKGRG